MDLPTSTLTLQPALQPTLQPTFAAFTDILVALLYIGFFIFSVLLIVIILLQEGKGGGFAAAFGGVGTEAFGVKAGGINKLTAVLAGLFVLCALLIGIIGSGGGSVAANTSISPTPEQSPGTTVPGGAPPAGAPAGTPVNR